MAESWRSLCWAQLHALLTEDPKQIVTMYCRIVGQSPSSQLPSNVSFMTMIDAILDAEALQRHNDATAGHDG